MSEKIYLLFLILCAILCKGIIATLSDEDKKEASDLLVRQKRVITHIEGRVTPRQIHEANYIVSIHQNNGAFCAGAILSHYTVITAAHCVRMQISAYTIISAARYENRGVKHNVTSKDVHFGNPPHQEYDGIALLTVDPLFVYSVKTGYINFYSGPLLPGTLVEVSGYGVSYPPQPPPTGMRRALRTIILPIINHRECQYDYRHQYAITEKYMCTYDSRQCCARTDGGAPLVFNNELAGIHVFKGERGERNPDIFIDLQRDEYSAWIRNNALLM